MRIFYRLRQFWRAIRPVITDDNLAIANQVLTPEQMALFLRMHKSEQMHSLRVCQDLVQDAEANHDLLTASLLHDVGKACYPLRPWERAMIVLGKVLMLDRMKLWSESDPRGWKKAFVVAEKHPQWGAEMAANAGASPLVVSLIRRHQESGISPEGLGAATDEDRLLYRLQTYDDES